jgi:DNA-binding HxlR family transcriptional regulator
MEDEATSRCSPSAMKLIADYWVLRIVEELHAAGEPLRFAALARALDGVSPVTLSNRLRRLEAEGLVVRTQGESGKTSVSYTLSDRGMHVPQIISAIHRFAEADQAT